MQIFKKSDQIGKKIFIRSSTMLIEMNLMFKLITYNYVCITMINVDSFDINVDK